MMNFSRVLSVRVLGALGYAMGIVGLLDTVIAVGRSHIGFGPMVCVIAVFYIRYSRIHKLETFTIPSFTHALKRIGLLLFSVSMIDICLLEIATRLPFLSSSDVLGYVGSWVGVVTFCAAASCFGYVFVGWLLTKVSG